MGDYEEKVGPVIDDAVAWAGQSTRWWLDTCARCVRDAAAGDTTSDTLARELSRMMSAGARDMARLASTWTMLGQAILTVDVAPPGGDGGGDDGGDGDGGENA